MLHVIADDVHILFSISVSCVSLRMSVYVCNVLFHVLPYNISQLDVYKEFSSLAFTQ